MSRLPPDQEAIMPPTRAKPRTLRIGGGPAIAGTPEEMKAKAVKLATELGQRHAKKQDETDADAVLIAYLQERGLPEDAGDELVNACIRAYQDGFDDAAERAYEARAS